MNPNRVRGALAIGVIALMILSAGVVWVSAGPGASSTASVTVGSPLGGTHTASQPPSPSSASTRAQNILRELRDSGIPASDIHLPDLSVPASRVGEAVSPTYSNAPAPMGVSDLGLRNVSGTLEPYLIRTSSVEGTLTLLNARSVNVDGDGPDMFGIQLNAVVTGITLFGNSTNQFWMQNFASYTPSSGQLVFGDNVWNFSNYAAYISPNVFYANGPNGTLFAPVYYYAVGPTFTIHYPFTVTFYENSTVMFDRPAVFFNYTVSNATTRTSGSYDFVVFNASAGTPTTRYPAGRFSIDGFRTDPVGLPNDLELDVLGNDDGDTTTFTQMDATMSIATWDSARHAYEPVPSAMDAGSETGETSDGVTVSYTPSAPVAHLALGPSFIYGLWNFSSSPGVRKVVLTLSPANTFVLVNPGAARNESEAQWVPSSPTGVTTFYLPNGPEYRLEYLLSDRDPGDFVVHSADNATTFLTFTGKLDTSRGVYTPLIAFGNGELPGIASGGAGTVTDPYVLENNEYGPIDPEFAAWNDYAFPVFPGVLLVGTNDYVTVTPPSFEVDYPSWMAGGLSGIQTLGLPGSNHLQLQFWRTSHVRVMDGTISGWLVEYLNGFPEGSVMFWNSSHNLVAGNTFLDQGDAIVLYGGTANTIWGNIFLAGTVSAPDPSNLLNYGPFTQGVNESESGDLIYNNYFDLPLPAVTPTLDPLSCQNVCNPAVYLDAWNVSVQPASSVRWVDGVPLSGSILDLPWQGGNYWSNYGSPTDPYGVLPYNDSGAIAYGGDYHPLIPFVLEEVRFHETGLPTGTTWSVTLNGYTQNSTAALMTFWEPADGSYPFVVGPVAGYVAHPSNGTVNVGVRTVTVGVRFT